ncbi:DNA cytosine methyltransferase [Brasilonema sp. UFV-L1]|uniref:DNA cytosine methyltransferase n=1 Tax=Brasilonema sp. UFV-L1 TaxID=2234130 RepID=UPI00169C42DA|nr:DNA cytosine methyltransferase [Brasilonema sp. UFV-L1]NMG09338.1 DNA cytosine methyltransferase [Brasilonema sp. UFV-L1]
MNDDVISIFSGAGGLSFGFTQAGLKPVFGIDINQDACQTYQLNLNSDCYQLDLGDEDQSKVRHLLTPYKKPFAVIGGPPCQGFSTAGSRDWKDPRNRLIFNYFSLVEYLEPRWFLFENVEGLLTSNQGQSIYELVCLFLNLGYSMRLEKINFAAYGLPQSRKRVVLIGNRMEIPFEFPQETYSFQAGKHNSLSLFLPHAPTLIDAISGLPDTSKKDEDLAYQLSPTTEYDVIMRHNNFTGLVRHHFSSPSPLDLERYKLLSQGQTMKDLPEEYWHPSFKRRAFRRVKDGMPTEKRGGAPSGIKRLYPNLCAPTITSAVSREFIHPIEDRPLTLREGARLQSFPDKYNFVGNASSIATQIGNAFPPNVAEIFAKNILYSDGLVGGQSHVNKSMQSKLIGYRLTDANGKSPALCRTEELLQSLVTYSMKEVTTYAI